MALFFKPRVASQGDATITSQTDRRVNWWTTLAFVLVLIVLLLFACYSGQIEKLQSLYKILIHGIEILCGLFAGIFIGESTK